MLKGLYTAYTGMVNEQNRMDVLTNNLANSATVGYKKEGATSQSFDTVLVDKIKDGSEDVRTARRIGQGNPGVKVGEGYTDYSQGAFRVTDNNYDFALSGDGFFTVEFTNKNGETSTMYTRDGNFTVTADGYLVTTDGDYVMARGANNSTERIKVNPNEAIVVDQQGRIMQNNQMVAQMKITNFNDYNYLEHYGENYYVPVEGAELELATDCKVFQGYLETSNVSIVSEMVEMISVSKQYEANQKLIQTYDSSLQIAANQLGKI
ncbi:MAG TPA: flagellar hook-basal body protein [Lachnospiraceae bacterium]|nr:flagellar hook-basal body protein [Lachnospiraceae bacterium]